MTSTPPDLATGLLQQAWSELVAGAVPDGAGGPDELEVTGAAGRLPSRLPVEDVAVACVGTAVGAAARLACQRGATTGPLSVDRGHVAAAVCSERHFRRGDQSAGAGFAPLSRFWRTADGWVRTHANYPWHRDALLRTLGTDEDADAVAGAMAERVAAEVEAAVFDAGGVAGAVRSWEDWRDHPQGQVLAGEPLVSHRLAGEAAPRARPVGDLPASGVRVLDLTRVIAGPVCTRYLAALGAEVLRLDPPDHPDMPRGVVADTLLGKRSALVDLTTPVGADILHHVLDSADVVVCGYRPGALDGYGLAEHDLAERHPGVVAVYLDAWGHSGPWAGRRGFDSIVQAPTGIAMLESADGDQPGVLPCQLLDHGTGYLAAAAALDGLRRQADEGGTHIRRVSLARTAWWLISAASGDPASAPRAELSAVPPASTELDPAVMAELGSARGSVTAVLPPGRLGTAPLRWPSPLTGYGDDPPAWSVGRASGPDS